MDNKVVEFKFSFLLKENWLKELSNKYNCKIVDNKYLYLPEEIGEGRIYFSEVLPDLSVTVMHSTFKEAVKFTRLPTEDDYWILYYDVSKENKEYTVNGDNHVIGDESKLRFVVIDCKLESTYTSKALEQIYSLRIAVRKEFLKSFFTIDQYAIFLSCIEKKTKSSMFFYGHIESKSYLALLQFMNLDFNHYSYDISLKSIVLELFSSFIDRVERFGQINKDYTKEDYLAIMKSQKYLLRDIRRPFPGLEILAQKSPMSLTKYKRVYKSIFNMNPGEFFKNEKLLLAKEMIDNGDFKTIEEAAKEFGYCKKAYFVSIYKKKFDIEL